MLALALRDVVMRREIRVVAPYRPFVPESIWHQESAGFDWIHAIRMMSRSVEIACRCPSFVITDVDTELPLPAFRYHTHHRRLMLWYLEIAAAYLESGDFDRDTIMLDSDQLIYKSLAPWFRRGVDLTIMIRPKVPREHGRLPILNGVQWWSAKAKPQLSAFYRRALAIAESAPEDRLVWGADTDALCDLLEPLEVGIQDRAGLRVLMVDSDEVLSALCTTEIRWLKERRPFWPARAVLDFRGRRKVHMPQVYASTIAKMTGARAS